MFWEIGQREPNFSAIYLKISDKIKAKYCWLWKYKFGEYLFQTFLVYKELIKTYMPQENPPK